MRPIEWAHGQSLRLLEWFNQERWTLMLTLLALLITNSFLLYLLLQGQDTRALAFVIILFVIVLSWLVPELSIAVLIVGGTGLYINLLFLHHRRRVWNGFAPDTTGTSACRVASRYLRIFAHAAC
jgi:hypothetical protein